MISNLDLWRAADILVKRYGADVTIRHTSGAQGERIVVAASKTAIAIRAYQIWESEGRPDGHDVDHWLRAEAELSEVLAPSIAEENQSRQKPSTRRRRSKGSKVGV